MWTWINGIVQLRSENRLSVTTGSYEGVYVARRYTGASEDRGS